MSSNTINVHVTTNTTSSEQSIKQTISTPLDIQAEAKMRLQKIKLQQEAIENANRIREEAEAEERVRQQKNELLKLEAEKLQIRLLAEKKLLEYEAQQAVELREAQIKAEMERLKNRTQYDIVQDDIAFLREKVKSLEAQVKNKC
jgi:hypothetical protein